MQRPRANSPVGQTLMFSHTSLQALIQASRLELIPVSSCLHDLRFRGAGKEHKAKGERHPPFLFHGGGRARYKSEGSGVKREDVEPGRPHAHLHPGCHWGAHACDLSRVFKWNWRPGPWLVGCWGIWRLYLGRLRTMSSCLKALPSGHETGQGEGACVSCTRTEPRHDTIP